MSEVLQLSVGKVHPDPDNPRSNLGDLTELSASIAELGVLEPVLVRDHPSKKGQWMLVAGHRRHAAASKAGLKELPALLIVLGDTEAVVLSLVENLQRADLAPIDEAKALQRLVDLGLKQKDIAQKISRSPGHISKRLTLLELPASAAKLLDAGSMKIEDAYLLASTLKVEGIDRDGLISSAVATAKSDRESNLSSSIRHAADQAKLEVERQKMIDALHTEQLLTSFAGAKRLDRWDFELPVNKHRKEPCSRFELERRWGNYSNKSPWQYVWWCAEPSRHGPKGESKLKVKVDDRSDWSKQQAERNRVAAESRAKRVETYRAPMAGALNGKPVLSAEAIFDEAALVVLHALGVTEAELALELLDVPFKRSIKWHDKVALLADSFKRNKTATTLAVAIAKLEFSYGWQGHVDDHRYQFALILGLGEQAAIDLDAEVDWDPDAVEEGVAV